MSFKDEMEAAYLESTAYHIILSGFRPYKVFGVVEGNDDFSFYNTKIEQILHDFGLRNWSVEIVSGGSKKEVLDLHDRIDWKRFPPKGLVFFVDRDLSHFVDDEMKRWKKTGLPNNIYVTDGYSIENDVVNELAFIGLLQGALKINQLTVDERDNARNRFCSELGNFKNIMSDVMTQIILWKRSGLRLKLNRINLKKCIPTSDGQYRLSFSRVDRKKVLKCFAERLGFDLSTQHEIEIAGKEFKENGGGQNFIRGKYLLWFFVEYTLAVQNNIQMFTMSYDGPPKCNINFSHGNALVHTAPIAVCPESLRNFVIKTLVDYANSKEEVSHLSARNTNNNFSRIISNLSINLLVRAFCWAGYVLTLGAFRCRN